MILATVQIAALLFTAYKLSSYDRHGCRYRFGISLVATIWAGASAALAVAMLLQWPEAVERASGVTAMMAGGSAALAWWCGGNVAELLRKVGRALSAPNL